MVKEETFDRLGAFLFSPQEGTPAAKLKNAVPEKLAQTRLDKLMREQAKVSRKRLKRYEGQTLRVLLEGESEEHEYLSQGRFFGQAPDIDGVVLITQAGLAAGEFRDVIVQKTQDHDLVADIVEG